MKQLTLIMALLCAVQVQAQDPKVHPYMQAVNDQFSMDEGYRIEMDYIHEDIMQETRALGDGVVWMKGLKYRIEIDEYLIYFDGEKLYSQNTNMEEVYVSTPDPDEPGYMEAVPLRVIKSYQQDFKYQLMGEKPFEGRQRIEIQLYPLDLSGPYSMLKLFMNPHTMKLEAFQLKHKEGINYTMIITGMAGKQDLDEGDFRFRQEDYPDTEIIELLE